jgi:hypothetical protein
MNRKMLSIILFALLAVGLSCMCSGLSPSSLIGACEPQPEEIQVNTPYSRYLDATNQGYPCNCAYYFVRIPDVSSSLTISLSGFSEDLDLYVGYSSIETILGEDAREDWQWKSNEFGLDDEVVTISNPETADPYYIEVCSYEATGSDYTIQASVP